MDEEQDYEMGEVDFPEEEIQEPTDADLDGIKVKTLDDVWTWIDDAIHFDDEPFEIE